MRFSFFVLFLALVFGASTPAHAKSMSAKIGDIQTKQKLQSQAIQNQEEQTTLRLEAMQKLLNAQDQRIGDLMLAEQKHSTNITIFALIITVLMLILGFFTYFSARNIAQKSVKEWMNVEGKNEIITQVKLLEPAILKEAKNIIDNDERLKLLFEDLIQETVKEAIDKEQIAEISKHIGMESKVSSDEKLKVSGLSSQVEKKPESERTYNDWFIQGMDAYQDKNYQDAITYWNHVINSKDARPEQLVIAQIYKGITYDLLDKQEEAISVYNEVIINYGDKPGLAISELVANALNNKAVILIKLDKTDEGIKTYDEIISRYESSSEISLNIRVAQALNDKGNHFHKTGNYEEALLIFEEVLLRYGISTQTPLRENVALALVNKGVTLCHLGKYEEALNIYDDVISRFESVTGPVIRERLSLAYGGKAFVFIAKGETAREKGDEKKTIEFLNTSLMFSDMALEITPQYSLFNSNKGEALFMLGRAVEAEDSLRSAFKIDRKYTYNATIKENLILSLQENAEYKKLIEKLYDETDPSK